METFPPLRIRLGIPSVLVVSATLCVLTATLWAFSAAPALATDGHVFDPVLSLRGNCNTNALDEVPDPGRCPMSPGEPGVDHPPKAFAEPCDTAVDRHGDIYVSSAATGGAKADGTEGRIDVFNPQGEYLTEIKDELQPCAITVDSEGNVYVAEYRSKNAVLFKSKSFPPVKGGEYEGPLIVREAVFEPEEKRCSSQTWSLAVDPSNDHLYAATGCNDTVFEYDSAANGNALLAKHDSEGLAERLEDIAVYGNNHDIYASGVSIDAVPNGRGNPEYARAFIFDGADSHAKCEIDGSATPQGGFGFSFARAGVAVDQANGDLYVDDVVAHGVVDQFDAGCGYVGQVEHSFTGTIIYGAGLAVDDPFPGQAGYDSPNEGELFVAQGETPSDYHLYAFAPLLPPKAPEAREQAAASVSETEAILEAEVNPNGQETIYHFQYTTQAAFEADSSEGTGYEHAITVPVPDASAGSDASFKTVRESIEGLVPETAYRFRLVASNHCVEAEPEALCTTVGEGKAGEEGTDAAFSTYAPETGLAEGRAYELVSPPDTGGLIPTFADRQPGGSGSVTPLVSPDGQSVLFNTEGGSLPDFEANGYHDTYVAARGPGGWQTSFAGLSGTLLSGSEAFLSASSPDHLYSFWEVGGGDGTLTRGSYLRGPSGVEPIGIGSLGEESGAGGRWIDEGGERIIFVSRDSVQLEPNAPPGGGSGINAIYERSADGPTEVLSLLPGDVTPKASAQYKGTSADGTATAFRIEGDLYVRLGGAETKLVAEGSEKDVGGVAAEPTFGGISAHGERIAYLRPNPSEPRRPNPVDGDPGPGPTQGEIFTYDSESEETTRVGSGDEAVLVNVSPDGSHVYFLSPEQLDGKEGKAGAENLYVWDTTSEAVRFIATVSERDVYGELVADVNSTVIDGLGLWTDYVLGTPASIVVGPGADPSRTSADGSVLIFASREALTAYDNQGHSEIYRYDADADALGCISCNPTRVPAAADARLQSPPARLLGFLPPVNAMAEVINLTPDGKRAFFESGEPLVLGDTDGLQDVYEWVAQGTGGCAKAGGCIHLISSGKSAFDDYLFGMTPNGSDVVFLSGDLLAAEDHDKTPSLYDARIGGGFPPPSPPAAECLGEACQPSVVVPGEPDSRVEGSGNPSLPTKPRCPKGKRQVRKAGKARCVVRHKQQRRRKRANANRRAHR